MGLPYFDFGLTITYKYVQCFGTYKSVTSVSTFYIYIVLNPIASIINVKCISFNNSVLNIYIK